MKSLICIGLLLVVSGCTTTVLAPNLPCKPPSIIMNKAEPLPKVNAKELDMKQIFETMVHDADQYNTLRDKNNHLIDWVGTHCN